MITFDQIKQPDTLNIFTDTSMLNKVHLASSGAHFYSGTTFIGEFVQIIPQATVNIGELMGVYFGLRQSLEYMKTGAFTTINLFSDSQITIFGLRDWVYNWVRDEGDGHLHGYANKRVQNETYFIHIINFILANNINVNLYHVRGHLDGDYFKNSRIFKENFISANNIQYVVDDTVVNFLIQGNSFIDNRTRDQFNTIGVDYVYNLPGDLISIFNWHDLIKSFDMEKYKQLTGGYNL